MTKLIDAKVDFEETSEGLVIAKQQVIPDSFLQALKAERDASKDVREKESMRVASIPTCIVDKWIKEGFDFWNESNAKIVAKLKHENLDYFVTTAKQI